MNSFKQAKISIALLSVMATSLASQANAQDFMGYKSALQTNPNQNTAQQAAPKPPVEKLEEVKVVKTNVNKESSIVSAAVEQKSTDDKVMRYTKKSKENKQKSLEVENGVVQVIYIGVNHINRLETPFENPVIRTSANKKLWTIKEDENILFIGTGQKKTPVTVFISPKEDKSISIPVVLIALDMPPKNIKINVKNYKRKAKVDPVLEEEKKQKELKRVERLASFEKKGANDYEGMLNELAVSLARGETPFGYETVDAMPGDNLCMQNGIEFSPFQRMSGISQDIIILKATNNSERTLQLKEKSCFVEGVRMVSAYPNVRLRPNESAEVYIVTGRDIKDKPQMRKRAF